MTLNELSETFFAFADLAAGLSTGVKVSWVVLMVWTIAQLASFRFLRVTALPVSAAPRRSVRRRPARKRVRAADTNPPEVVTDLGISVHASAAVENAYR